jgi:hypothetical protein
MRISCAGCVKKNQQRKEPSIASELRYRKRVDVVTAVK